MEGSCEHTNEPSGSIKGPEFLDKLCDRLLASEEGLYSMEFAVGRFLQNVV
jgi:hypothetical protein